ncbi:MAG: ClpXP protease specificity-enhancing factor SspB [Pseudomonadota bacterium]|nr:ClpXP protease specificity-enhancing factor SspB [Pseudomonadota bacterium]
MGKENQTEWRPYLLRAMHEWMSDNGHTPHIVVNADVDGLVVPEEHVLDKKIILNVSQSATKDLIITNQLVSFETRFARIPQIMKIPISAVLGIYARETREGISFENEQQPPGRNHSDKGASKRPRLRVVE